MTISRATIPTLWVSLSALLVTHAELPDVTTVAPDLAVPQVTAGTPAPGARTRQVTPGFTGTGVYHALYLPTDWEAGKRYPVIVEYAGNGGYANRYGDRCNGTVDGCNLGFGASGGHGYIWVCMPYISADHRRNQLTWWGDVKATADYCKTTVARICRDYGGDPDAVFLAGFSRGSLACNYIGLHDDEIASLWRGFICHSHYDGVRDWGYADSDRAAAVQRLARLGRRPQFISHEGSVNETKAYLAEVCPDGAFTFVALPYRNHTDTWVLRDIAERQRLRTWLTEICAADAPANVPWDLKALAEPPEVWEDPAHSTNGVRALFYAGLPWQGQPTRVFAYYAAPKTDAGRKVPAMVLVHGGGGSAFIPWVRLWVDRGYAAIAMDTCGSVSGGGYNNHPRHALGGPAGWGGFDQITQPVEDQWTYHAVGDVILAHSLIRSFPEVDGERIGLTGISWGGYLTCIVAGVDPRFQFAAPVYGCGFLGDNSTWLDAFQQMGKVSAARWLALWDPSSYLRHARMPLLWVTGSNDFAYPMDSLQKSYRLPASPRTLCLRVRMPHGHGGAGENPEEIHAMADAILGQGLPLARVTGCGRNGRNAWTTFESRSPIVKAELNYTTDSGKWSDRKWQTSSAVLDAAAGRATAEIHENVTVYYFNLIDNRDLVVSSEHEDMR